MYGETIRYMVGALFFACLLLTSTLLSAYPFYSPTHHRTNTLRENTGFVLYLRLKSGSSLGVGVGLRLINSVLRPKPMTKLTKNTITSAIISFA